MLVQLRRARWQASRRRLALRPRREQRLPAQRLRADAKPGEQLARETFGRFSETDKQMLCTNVAMSKPPRCRDAAKARSSTLFIRGDTPIQLLSGGAAVSTFSAFVSI